jgi:hypothetical protein
MVRFHSQVDLMSLDSIFKKIPVAVDDLTKAYSMISLSGLSIRPDSFFCNVNQ